MVVVKLAVKALLLLLLLTVTACDPPTEPVSEKDVYGIWVASGPNGRTGTLEFRPDKSFTGKDLPDRVFYGVFDRKHGGPPDWTAIDKIKGTWSTNWDPGIKEAYVIINIEGRGDQYRISVKGQGGDKYLSYYYSDPDSAEFLDFRKAKG